MMLQERPPFYNMVEGSLYLKPVVLHLAVPLCAALLRSGKLAFGVTLSGVKEALGLWVAQTEGAKFWLQVVTV